MLFDIDRMDWSQELCDEFHVPMGMLPEVRRSSGAFGIALGELLGVDIPILGIAGDQQAAFGAKGAGRAGMGKNTYGTGAFLMVHAGATRPNAQQGLLTTISCDATGGVAYALEAAIFIAGAAVQWLRDGLEIIATASRHRRTGAVDSVDRRSVLCTCSHRTWRTALGG